MSSLSSFSPPLPDDVVLSVRNVSKKFCRNLRRSMLYGMRDLGRSLLGIRPRVEGGTLTPGEVRRAQGSRPGSDVFPDSASRQHPSSLRKDEFWALQNISFDLRRGEALGIIGQNGSGKSTLLRILNGIFPPDEGSVLIRGRVGGLIALGAGMHPHLTGLENIFLNGAILGMTRRQIEGKLSDIINFAEIGEFIHAPLSTYSSGMKVRLGFAVAIQAAPDVLLVDEVLAVGDNRFQNRCYEVIRELRENGGTILFVSHALETVQYLCQRTMLLDSGKVVADGSPESVITEYENTLYRAESAFVEKGFSEPFTTEKFRLMSARVVHGEALTTRSDSSREACRVDLDCETRVPVDDLIFTFSLLNQRRESCIWEYEEGDKFKTGIRSGRFRLSVSLPPVPLSGGLYMINLMVRHRVSFQKLFHHKGVARVIVGAAARERGMLTVPIQWRFAALEESGAD